MEFKVSYAKNGLILKSPDGDILYQGDFSGEDQAVEKFADFLATILEEYGPSTSRYSPKRIYIKVEPGDKFEETYE